MSKSDAHSASRAGLLALLGLCLTGAALGADDVAAGRRIYEQGLLPDGTALTGRRWDSAVVSGSQAACVACHKRSGMGTVEGDIQVPPITGNALFGTGDKVIANMDPRSGKAFNRAHQPYTDESVARAMRSGMRGDENRMHVLMPRYNLRDGEMKSLLAYLRQLSATWSPGVSATLIRFATVITPEVTAQRRAMFTDMVHKIVAQKNGSTAVAGSRKTRHHMASAAELVLGTERNWAIDVWELKGAPETWTQQLDEFYARQPVFALVSGLGGEDWGPIDAFCDRQAVPCWFPSVDLPPKATPAYSIYFNRGVTLEAEVLANHLTGLGTRTPRRLLQVFHDDTVGRGASGALAASLAASTITVRNLPLVGNSAKALRTALGDLSADDAVMFWMRPADVSLLDSLPAPHAAMFFSAKLGGADLAAIPQAWKPAARFVYPYELPELRAANLAYFKAWMNQRHVPMVDEATQSEVYFAFAFLTDTITDMLDNLYRDYLIERAETMISRREGSKAEAEYYSSTQSHVRTHSQLADGSIATMPDSTEAAGLRALRLAGTSFHKREGTSVYPRLGLGPGQRFASKGGYIAHIAAGGAMVADSRWSVP